MAHITYTDEEKKAVEEVEAAVRRLNGAITSAAKLGLFVEEDVRRTTQIKSGVLVGYPYFIVSVYFRGTPR